MKKSILLCSLMALTASGAHATDQPLSRISVEGTKARTLLLAFEDAGAKSTTFMNVVRLNVREIKCFEDFSIAARCNLKQDLGDSDVHEISFQADNDKAKNLINALEDVGVKADGTYLKNYSVESASCTALHLGPIGIGPSCTLELKE